MDCPETVLTNDNDYLEKFRLKAVEKRIPVSGSIELTYRCNLRCIHCYLDRRSNLESTIARELTTQQIIAIIDQISDAGCLLLLLTGGEPLSRNDFPEIYQHAKKRGLILTVFTNGTLVTDAILELFKALPPYAVEISLYGASQTTYEKITGIKGSYAQCMNGITSLLQHKINVKLKTILMTLNKHEFSEIENIAKSLGVKFRFDASISPCLNGNKAPLNLRVFPEEAVEKEFADRERLRLWREYFMRNQEPLNSDKLYVCSAGLTMFHIDPYGKLKPCLSCNEIQYDLSNGDFLSGWHTAIPKIMEKRVPSNYPCNHCNKVALCNHCPADAELETGSACIPSEYQCKMAAYRCHMMYNMSGDTFDERG